MARRRCSGIRIVVCMVVGVIVVEERRGKGRVGVRLVSLQLRPRIGVLVRAVGLSGWLIVLGLQGARFRAFMICRRRAGAMACTAGRDATGFD